jgi:Helicase HerA, central domain
MSHEAYGTAHVDYLQRSHLDPAALAATARPAGGTRPELRRLWRAEGIGRLEKAVDVSRELRLHLPSRDMLTGLFGQRLPVAFVVRGTPRGVSICLGTWSDATRERVSGEVLNARQGVLGAALSSLYPAIELTSAATELPRFPLSGFVLGIPSAKAPDQGDGALQIDRLIRSMSGLSWACVVLAEPVEERVTTGLRNTVINELRQAQAAAHAQGVPAPLAGYYSELLTLGLKALASGLEVGMWRTGAYLLGDADSYFRLASVWRGIFSGDDSLPEPLRVWDTDEAGQLAADWALPEVAEDPGPGYYRHPLRHQTLLTSSQLAAYVHLPQLETSGFRVSTVPDFDAVPPTVEGDRTLSLGHVKLRGRLTQTEYAIALEDLSRHALVAGVTGAGKSNTIFHLLKQASRQGVPFLVVEPAKTEYRALLEEPEMNGRLRVFTLGDELTAPFRLNPFEVVGWPAVPVGVHLDLLRSVFSASFGMWTPLPQILERCLHEIYVDRGWDIATNTNHRLDERSALADAFPTMTELAAKVDAVIRTLGYEAKIADDLRAALTTRVNGLRTGSKGRMLDVGYSVPMEALLGQPTVLELQEVGDDDDKAFLIGLLLIRLYEHRRAGGAQAGLRHLMVIEEAHRLLTNVGSAHSQEDANPRHKAVEVFANVLAEIRAYGQGVIVADQIPVKLAPEIIKNTNLKIVHRLVAADDRGALAGSMTMSERQARALATLTRGQAVVFAEPDDAPVLVEVPSAKGATVPDNVRVKRYMAASPMAGSQDPLPMTAVSPDGTTPARIAAEGAARTFASDQLFRREFARLVVSIAEDDGALGRLWSDLVLRAQGQFRAGTDRTVFLRTLIQHASAWLASRRGMQGGWSFSDTAALRDSVQSVLLSKLEGRDAGPALDTFRALTDRLHARDVDPFPGCSHICADHRRRCLYRFAVSDAIETSHAALLDDWNAAYADGGRPAALSFLSTQASALIEGHPDHAAATTRVQLCVAQHMLASQFPADHQLILETLLPTAPDVGHSAA